MKQLSYKNMSQKELLKKLNDLKIELGQKIFSSKDSSNNSSSNSTVKLKKDIARIKTALRENF